MNKRLRYAKWVCFTHRHVSKRAGLCPTCQNELLCLGDTARIPKKESDKGWKQLFEWATEMRYVNGKPNRSSGSYLK
jgi:hypothetical protein